MCKSRAKSVEEIRIRWIISKKEITQEDMRDIDLPYDNN
jgi:hypothetical protein